MPLTTTIDAAGQTFSLAETTIIIDSSGNASLRIIVDTVDAFGDSKRIEKTLTVSDITAAGQGATAVSAQNDLASVIEAVAQNKWGA